MPLNTHLYHITVNTIELEIECALPELNEKYSTNLSKEEVRERIGCRTLVENCNLIIGITGNGIGHPTTGIDILKLYEEAIESEGKEPSYLGEGI
ncbi:hypothetical protein CMI42_05360 [Candidatus Pacearchaeota archaeon]|nr:hypothetical protein [Candidatus Pacearchaeota archaeon]